MDRVPRLALGDDTIWQSGLNDLIKMSGGMYDSVKGAGVFYFNLVFNIPSSGNSIGFRALVMVIDIEGVPVRIWEFSVDLGITVVV